MSTAPVISFVIPVRDDAQRLENCLRSILASGGSHGSIEIVVADNGSRDNSADVARRLGARVLALPDLKVGQLRNEASKAASAPLLAFVDADHLLGPHWVSSALEVMSDEQVAGAGALCHAPADATWVQRTYDAMRGRFEGQRDVEWLGAGNLLVRRDAFHQVGGFDESLVACEDVDLCNRLRAHGWRLVGDDRLFSVHLGDPPTLGRLFKGELWRGRDNLRVTLRGPLTLRSLPSVVLPVALLAVAASLVAVLVLRPAGWPALAGVLLAAMAMAVGQRAARIFANVPTRTPLTALQALVTAAAYEWARALALVWRAGHHR